MIKQCKNTVSVSIAMLLLIALLVQLSSSYIYLHSHVLPDGTVITHTHPYTKDNSSDPYKTHIHKGFDKVFADSLLLLIILSALGYCLFAVNCKIFSCNFTKQVLSNIVLNIPGRSPPVI